MELKRWLIPDADHALSQSLSKELNLPALITDILVGRGFVLPQTIGELMGHEGLLGDPFALADMEQAVARIAKALELEQRMVVYGDYDCDGITSTAMLYDYLDSVGGDVSYYIPSREGEGYGLNRAAIEFIHKNKVDLIITVDNGVSAIEEIAYANELGLDVVVTDHHKPREILPEAVAVVNPHRIDDSYPFKQLAGVGVAFKLICALEHDDGQAVLEQYAELITLGTIADCVPLVGENRTIVRAGLQRLGETENAGLSALIQASGLEGREIGSESVAFGLVPRINATGRIGSVDDAIELLLCGDPDRALELAKHLCNLNAQRKDMEQGILEDITTQIAEDTQVLNRRVLVFYGKDWHHGLVGIVASRIVDRYGKPCLLFSIDGDEARGSGRSVEGFNIIEAISHCSGLLTRYGGHNQAAGLTLKADKLPQLTQQMEQFAREQYDIMPVQTLRIDRELAPGELTLENAKYISLLEPFGEGCASPVFAMRHAKLDGIFPMGEGKHLRLRLTRDGGQLNIAYFNSTVERFPFMVGDTVDVAFQMGVNEWNGEERLSLKLRDIRLSAIDQEQFYYDKQFYDKFRRMEPLPPDVTRIMEPGREELAQVYRFLKEAGSFYGSCDALYSRLAKSGLGYLKLRLILDILLEMNLIERCEKNGRSCLSVVVRSDKADLETSGVLTKIRTYPEETPVRALA